MDRFLFDESTKCANKMPKNYLFINQYDKIKSDFKLPVFDTSGARLKPKAQRLELKTFDLRK
jgi:hypothetical protein